ncbi:MAG: glycosyltransferase family 39 protein [Anaerolineae bacterium]|nr:glycosyltransferase family 39 protein [Anaerolineae bacterium]
MTLLSAPALTQRRSAAHWALLVAAILLAWALRLILLDSVPPGWRDDELINVHALSGELLQGRFPLYFTGASGHEPLYHYLHAGLHVLLGFNVLSGHLLSAVLGTLAVPLAYVLARRLFGRWTGLLAALLLATSFWSLMYSRVAMRHITVVPLALLACYLAWSPLAGRPGPAGRWVIPLGLVLAAGLYTYPAARLLPALLVVFALYLALFHRRLFQRSWRGYALALLLALLLAIPLAAAIWRGSSEAAAEGIGADARLVELALPVRALRQGDPGPLLESIWITLGMFHASGDPEWLYNVAGRPVFHLLGGLCFWAGVLVALLHWRQPRYFFLLLWLAAGLLPTVLSVPAASLSHSILVQPLAGLLLLLPFCRLAHCAARRSLPVARSLLLCAAALTVVSTVHRDLRDYFVRWPQESMVRFLYRADYRDAARTIDAHPESRDWAVGSLLMGPWDRLALQVDSQRGGLSVRLFNPQRAVVWAAGTAPTLALVPAFPQPSSPIADILPEGAPVPATQLVQYTLSPARLPAAGKAAGWFDNGLTLTSISWPGGPAAPGGTAQLLTGWRLDASLQIPPLPIVANPPPPGVYAGPRLAVFAHLLAADGTLLAVDDGLWVDPLTLQPGDHFVQLHSFSLPADAPPPPYTLEIGLYDPLTGARWTVRAPDSAPADRLLFR